MVRKRCGNGCGQIPVFVAVTVNFTSSNFTSVKKGTAVVCVSKDAMTTSSITVEFTIQSSCGRFD